MRAEDLVPPFFHFSDDVVSFESIEQMTMYVEPWDVSDDDRAFDARGRRVVLRGVGVMRGRWTVGGGETIFDPAASGEVASRELVALLRGLARRTRGARLPIEGDVDSASLEDLVVALAPLTRVPGWRRR